MYVIYWLADSTAPTTIATTHDTPVLGIAHPEVSSPVGHPEVSTPQNPVVEDDHITDVLTTDVTPEDRRSYRDVLIG